MDIPENSGPIAPGESQKEAASSAGDAVSSHTGMDRRQFLRVSGLAAGTALAGAAQAHAPRQADAMGTATDRRVDPKTEPPATGAALKARKKRLLFVILPARSVRSFREYPCYFLSLENKKRP